MIKFNRNTKKEKHIKCALKHNLFIKGPIKTEQKHVKTFIRICNK